LVLVFTLSAVAYSRRLGREPGFVTSELFLVGATTILVAFFVLRILDEHKDASEDRHFRPELPVPRGLVTLGELRWAGIVAGGGALLLNGVVAPALLWPCLAVGLWAALMTQEFFVADWLRARPALYLSSHMPIMPLLAGYATALDWLAGGRQPPTGLGLFLVLTLLNGTLLEIGRKLRAPAEERQGVETYTQAWGPRAAPAAWLAALAMAAVTAALALAFQESGWVAGAVLLLLTALCAGPAIRFHATAASVWARRVEGASGLWTVGTYLLLAAGLFGSRVPTS
jgi:4-hydroxybenzoate polyprenyltransferase